VEPGIYTVREKLSWLDRPIDGSHEDKSIEITVEPGKYYYINFKILSAAVNHGYSVVPAGSIPVVVPDTKVYSKEKFVLENSEMASWRLNKCVYVGNSFKN
jgi:hypothetical protein